MKTLQVELPEALATEVEEAVRSGWFADENEVVREALRQLMSHREYALRERQQLEDIEWAVAQSQP